MIFPANSPLQSITLTAYNPNFYSESRSLIGHARKIPANRFECQFKTAILDPINSGEMWGFIHALEGRLNPFSIVLPTYSDTKGSLTSNPTALSSAAAGQRIITVQGLPANQFNLLITGDHIKAAGHNKVYVVKSPLNSDGSGQGTIELTTQLQKGVSPNESITVNQVPFTFRLRTDKSVFKKAVNDQGFYTFNFDCVEAF